MLESVLYGCMSEGWGPAHNASALFKLKDGRYGIVYESEDTSGHGCVCNGSVDYFNDLESALRLGLTEFDRDHYNAGTFTVVSEY